MTTTTRCCSTGMATGHRPTPASPASTRNVARARRPTRPARSPGRTSARWRWRRRTPKRSGASRPTSRSADAPSRRAPTRSTAARPSNRDKPICRAGADLNALVYQDALEVYKRAGQATGTEQRLLYEQSATMLLAAVNSNPGDRQAPVALEYAALALEATNRFESAGQLYQRIIDEVGPRQAEDAEEQQKPRRDSGERSLQACVHGQPQLRLRSRGRELPRPRGLARASPSRQTLEVQSKRADGLVNSAVLLEQLQRYPEATQYYRRVYRHGADRRDEAKRALPNRRDGLQARALPAGDQRHARVHQGLRQRWRGRRAGGASALADRAVLEGARTNERLPQRRSTR